MKTEYRALVSERTFPGDRQVRGLISAETSDRYGETLLAAGCDMTAYRANPVVLWAHEQYVPPIGRAVEVWAEPGVGVWAVDEFAPTPFAQELYDLYRGGFLSAFSVGFRASARDTSGNVISAWELHEHSAVAVPANPDALVRAATDHGSDAAAMLLRAYYPEAKDSNEAVRIAQDIRRLTGSVESLRNIHRHYLKLGLTPPVAEAALAPAVDLLKELAPGLWPAAIPDPAPAQEPDPADGAPSDDDLRVLTADLEDLRGIIAANQRAFGTAIAALAAREQMRRAAIGGMP